MAVFFKGCPLGCLWCHNPESISHKIQKMYNRDKCIGCQECVKACPEQACSLTPEGIVTDLSLCHRGCHGECAEVCPTLATEMSGREISVDEIIHLAEKERVFFEESGGGVTISGGEPLQQKEFLISLLDALGSRTIHRAVDTTGFCPSETLLEVARRTDLFLFDLKHMDSSIHKKYTGVENGQILKNIELLAKSGAEILIRIPLVGGVNDDKKNISETAQFVASLDGEKKEVNLLPYHNIASNKYTRLGVTQPADELREPEAKNVEEAIAIFTAHGLSATVGG